jgi:fructosamine-3-kinase
MNVPEAVSTWLAKQEYGQIVSKEPVGGGCINDGSRLTTESGASFFLKQNTRVPEDMFECEANGLKALTIESGPRVPIPYLSSQNFLLLEDLKPARRKNTFWRSLGTKLAKMHQNTCPNFGFDHNNYIGSTPQRNTWTQDGFEFFGAQRLSFQADLALSNGYLERTDLTRLKRIINSLPTLVPEQPASLLHGDLWSGNAIADEEGNPAIIDPAVHYGWAEAELGMTALFGGFPQEFYDAYADERPLQSGWRDRLPIYNLYHLLNHVNLFGYGYLGQVRGILKRYA